MVVEGIDTSPIARQIPQPAGRHVSLPSQIYWQLMDARRGPERAGRRREFLELIHRVTGAAVTTLFSGSRNLELTDQIGEPAVDIKLDDRARRALSTRRTVAIEAGGRWELGNGTIFTDGLWRPLDAQGINVGLLRLLALTPKSFHRGTVTLLDFVADWLALSLVADDRQSVWVNPALGGRDNDGFDGDLDAVASLVVASSRARRPSPDSRRGGQVTDQAATDLVGMDILLRNTANSPLISRTWRNEPLNSH